jgi:pimeloyl-ACP methyl ester carboxylesterase
MLRDILRTPCSWVAGTSPAMTVRRGASANLCELWSPTSCSARSLRMRRRLAAAVTFLVLSLLAQACLAGERRVELPGGRRIFMHCMGEGSPTVIFESGYRGSSGAWFKVQPQVAKFTRACAYDRAGYGQSDPGPDPRDGAAVAHDLDAALRAADIAGPFVMVGHSAGGLYVRLFAELRPKDVVGMVLVDPSVEHQDRQFAAEFGPGQGGTTGTRAQAARCLQAAEQGLLPSNEPQLSACMPKPRKDPEASKEAVAEALRASTWATAVSELDTLWTSTSDEVDRSPGSYGDMQLIVLTAEGTYAGNPPAAATAAEGLWRRMHQQLAARSTQGQERLVTGASHMIMLDRPDAVTDAVREVVQQARAKNRGG